MAWRMLTTVTVAAAGTRQRLGIATADCTQVLIQVRRANTGAIWLGDVSVSSALGIELATPTAGVQLASINIVPRGPGNNLDLDQLYIDAEVNGNGINIFAEFF